MKKLLARGPSALTDAELLAIVLRTGTRGQKRAAVGGRAAGPHQHRRRQSFGGLGGLLQASQADLSG